MSVRNKTNSPLVRARHFRNKMGVDSQHLQKSSVTNGRVAVKDIKKFPVKKIQQKGNFLQEKQKKKHSKEKVYIKEIVPLPFAGRDLPEIVLIQQLRNIHPMVRNLCRIVIASNFSLAGRLQYIVKH